jgi:hypothetical protein
MSVGLGSGFGRLLPDRAMKVVLVWWVEVLAGWLYHRHFTSVRAGAVPRGLPLRLVTTGFTILPDLRSW